jgi:beta-phosphoglucomutase
MEGMQTGELNAKNKIEEFNLIKAVIFDLDGVIVDTAHYHYLAWKKLANELGIELSLQDNEQLKGISRMKSLEIILQLGGVALPSQYEMEKLANKKNTWFVDFIERMAPEEIFPGVKPLIGKMRAMGLKIGLASSSKNAKMVLDLLHIPALFDVVVDGNMVTHSKPDPEIFLLAATRLGVSTSDCLVFEDAEAGVEAALKAGMKCVGIGSADQLGKADLIISRTGDFHLEMLDQWN